MEEFQITNSNINLASQEYNDKDLNILNPNYINTEFGYENDVIEFYILDNNNNILDINYNFKNYSTKNTVNNSSLYNEISLQPENDLLSYGYSDGDYTVYYNFYRNLFNSSNNNRFFINDISTDRKELVISNTNLTYDELNKLFISYTVDKSNRAFYSDFILNFGENNTVIGVNVLIDPNSDNVNLFIKLYDALPSNYGLKDTVWINEIISDPISFSLSKEFLIENNDSLELLKGPNFDIDINNNISTTTQYFNINNILSNNDSESFNRLKSMDENININIDFNDFSNFIHFSSITERINNFVYKMQQLEKLNNDSIIINSISTGSIGNSLININNNINYITQNFDKYEQFLYYNSGSNSFPKSNNVKPYINHSVTSSEVLNWLGSYDDYNQYYGGKLLESNNYDNDNRDYIWNNMPEYIRIDTQNDQLKLFTSMIGQHFDYLWTYIKDITNKNDNDNRIDFGISKDMVAETLKSFGIKLYTNSRNNNNIYLSLLGINPDGSFLPTTGSYVIDNYVTASNYTIPDNDINKEVYKRIYNNLPYLLKSKGTRNGLKALINCFGIPETILRIKEFGGVTKDLDLIENTISKFNYSFNGNNTSYLEIPWLPSYSNYISTSLLETPKSIEFRIKTDQTSSQNILLINDKLEINTINGGIYFGLKGDSGFITSSINLIDDNWNNISLNKEKIYTDVNEGYFKYILYSGTSSSLYSSSLTSSFSGSTVGTIENSWNSYDVGNNIEFGKNYTGSLQEFRLWNNPLTINDFQNHILYPKSISYLNETGSYYNLIYRLPLGSELDKNINQYITSSVPSNLKPFYSGSIIQNEGEIINPSVDNYINNYEEYLINTPNIGSYTESNNKINIINNDLLPDNVLSHIIKLEDSNINLTENSSDIEIAFSPQDSINSDIIEQLGNFNIDNYIGDPRDKSKSIYPDLEKLKLFYFQKYVKSYNIFDLIKLLSYFDNSLFKMLKDYIPARSDIFTGLIIQSPILERNKSPRFEPILSSECFEGYISTSFIEGSSGPNSSFNSYNTKIVTNELGEISIVSNDNIEFFNGEFKGSNIVVHSLPNTNIITELNKLPVDNLNEDLKNIVLNPLENNADGNRKSNKLYKATYSNNINTPTNINYLTASLLYNVNNSILDAEIQHTNYSLYRHNSPRYLGSKMIAKEYNIYNIGDKSYGKQSILDNNNIKFAYFEEITSQSLTFPQRSNVYIKYLIDGNGNITELSRTNKNLFDIQSIFNKTDADILLDNNQSPSIQKQLDGLTNIYAGGYKFEPVFHNLINNTSTNNALHFLYENDIQIINENSSSVTSSLANSSLTISNPIIELLSTTNNPLNTFSDTLYYNNNFKIKFNINRNTPYPGEIRQRITGSVKVSIEVTPFTDFITTLYHNSDGSGEQWVVTGSLEDFWLQGNPYGSPLYNSSNRIRSLNITSGSKVTIANSTAPNTYNYSTTYTTPGFHNSTPYPFNLPLTNGSAGVDYLKISPLDNISCSYFLEQYRNDFGTIPTNNLSSSTFLLDDSKIIDITFDVIGDIIIPDGTTMGTFYLHKINTNQIGIIESKIKLNSINNALTITQKIPTAYNLNSLQLNQSPYYYTNPPEYLYITGSIDHGFNSGSSPTNNWYFERQNSLDSGSNFNILASSYYLSNIVYNNILTNNSMIQSIPDLTSLGYEDIEDNFDMKIGDVVRFYNHDKNQFPVSFENQIKKIVYPLSPPTTGSFDNRLKIYFKDDIPNLACLDYYDSGSLSKKIQNFIFLSKKNDETNIVINKPKRLGQTSTGIIIPNNLEKSVKDNAGNIIKQLKNQNLI